MSKLAPRNATVEVGDHNDGSKFVRKTYRATYTALDEQLAYGRVEHIYRDCPDIRIARFFEIDSDNNSFTLEFIPGKSLYEFAAEGDFKSLSDWHTRLIAPFVLARNEGLCFDSDPSNYLVHADTAELVAIDPVCADIRIDDYAAVVFLWGIIKLMLRTPKVWRYPGLLRIGRSFKKLYLTAADVSSDDFNQQMVTYIDVVIGWNREVSPVDSKAMTLIRKYLAIPLYSIARFAIRRNLV